MINKREWRSVKHNSSNIKYIMWWWGYMLRLYWVIFRPSCTRSIQGPEDDSEESKHVAPLSHYMFNFTTVVFDGTSPPFISRTFRDGTPQVHMIKCPVPVIARSKGTATLEPELTKHSRPNMYLDIHRQTSMATFRPTCLSRLLSTKGLRFLSLLIVGYVKVTWCKRLKMIGPNFCWYRVTCTWR